jgi:hypothetical protein
MHLLHLTRIYYIYAHNTCTQYMHIYIYIYIYACSLTELGSVLPLEVCGVLGLVWLLDREAAKTCVRAFVHMHVYNSVCIH